LSASKKSFVLVAVVIPVEAGIQSFQLVTMNTYMISNILMTVIMFFYCNPLRKSSTIVSDLNFHTDYMLLK